MDKKCLTCLETKPLSAFSKNGNGFRPRCKDCHRIEYYAKKGIEPPIRSIDEEGKKTCLSCEISKDISEFYPKPRGRYGRAAICIKCESIRCRNNSYFTKYGITIEQYFDLLKRQEYRCAACGRHESEFSKPLHIDHNHGCCPGQGRSCGECIRGLLCHGCNVSEGLLLAPKAYFGLLKYLGYDIEAELKRYLEDL